MSPVHHRAIRKGDKFEMTSGKFVVWDKSFSVENEALDSEHRKIMSALNRLHCLEKEEIKTAVVKSILQDLLHYTEQHCAHEEKLMLQWEFSGYEVQQTAHREMIKNTRQIVSRSYCDNEVDLFNHSVSLLNQWWVNHIQSLDHEYIFAMHSFSRRKTER